MKFSCELRERNECKIEKSIMVIKLVQHQNVYCKALYEDEKISKFSKVLYNQRTSMICTTSPWCLSPTLPTKLSGSLQWQILEVRASFLQNIVYMVNAWSVSLSTVRQYNKRVVYSFDRTYWRETPSIHSKYKVSEKITGKMSVEQRDAGMKMNRSKR